MGTGRLISFGSSIQGRISIMVTHTFLDTLRTTAAEGDISKEWRVMTA